MIYAYIILAVICFSFFVYLDWRRGHNIVLGDLLGFFFIFGIIWPVGIVIAVAFWFSDNKGKVIIKGKKKVE